MRPGRHQATSLNLRIVTEGLADLRANHHVGPDTRRFATLFPLEAPGANSTDSGDTTHEEQNDSDDLLRSKLIATLDEDAFVTQAASEASVDRSSTLSAAQLAMACYHGSDHPPEFGTTEKELPQIPGDQRSMYTLGTSADTQSKDMMWKPQPKIHMRRTDQQALMQAQNQAIAMMLNAGLKFTNRIQCRRRGCADILPNVEALKYHLHIHNIADATDDRICVSPSAARKCSVVECGTSNPKALGRNHSRSNTSHGTRRGPTMYPLPRRLSAGSLFPSLFSPREGTLEDLQVPSLTAVARTLTSDHAQNEPESPPAARDGKAHSTQIPTPSRGRRKRKKGTAVSVAAECSLSPSIAKLLSPPSSPIMQDRLVLAPRAKVSMPVALGPAEGSGNCEGVHPVSERLTGSRSPMRALSPTRAMSPIRSGIKRLLAIGSTDQ